MIPLMMAGQSPLPLYDIIKERGLLTNLKICLDAGDIASYDGSSQTWVDRSSNAYSFFRGATSGAAADDPTFNGSAGGRRSYFSVDGGDIFRLNQSNPAAVNDIHKDNAAFTLFALMYPGSTAAATIAGTNTVSSATTGFHWVRSSSNIPSFVSTKSVNGTPALSVAATTALSLSAWNAVAVSINEPGASGFFWQNGAYNQVSASDTFNATYATPSAGAASQTMGIFDAGSGGSTPAASGDRIACFALFGEALTKAQLDGIWSRLRGRLGL